MLTFLEIENILLVKSLAVSFMRGMCVLTGETGAGKSIILNSILLLLGKKTKTDIKSLVREGCEKGFVNGSFDISNNLELRTFLRDKGFESEEEIIIKRIISKTEKDRIFLNGSLISASLLVEIGNFLIEVNRQNEQISLLEKSYHLKILDLYSETGAELSMVESAYKDLAEILAQKKATIEMLEKFKNERDYLEFLVQEISKLAPEEGEEEKLTSQKIEISKAIKQTQSVNDVMQKLFYEKNIRSSFVSALKMLSDHAEAEEIIERILVEIDGLEEVLSAAVYGEASESTLDKLNERLFLIRDIARKYKVKPDELPEFLQEQKRILESINLSDAKLLELSVKEKEAQAKYNDCARALSAKRKIHAKKLEDQINGEFESLQMKGANFFVEFSDLPKATLQGVDCVEFLIQTNVGTKRGSIAKIASGGELSRILLAIKIALLKIQTIQTVIFDEIDAGIGGMAALAVGEKLKELSKCVQIILITHQAQIASKADLHLKIAKTEIDGEMHTNLKPLNLVEKEYEIARMLTGSTSEESLLNARQILNF